MIGRRQGGAGTVISTARPQHQRMRRAVAAPTGATYERRLGCECQGSGRSGRSPSRRTTAKPSWRSCGGRRSRVAERRGSSGCSPTPTTRSSASAARSHGAPRRVRSRRSCPSRRARPARSGRRQPPRGGCSEPSGPRSWKPRPRPRRRPRHVPGPGRRSARGAAAGGRRRGGANGHRSASGRMSSSRSGLMAGTGTPTMSRPAWRPWRRLAPCPSRHGCCTPGSRCAGRSWSMRIVDWLTSHPQRFTGTPAFGHALKLFADGTSMLGFAADHLRVEWFPAGSFIIEQGEPATQLFCILSGSAAIVLESDDGGMHHQATRGAGCFVGEDGLAARRPRNAHVIANDDVTCLVLAPEEPSRSTGRGADAAVAPAAAATPRAAAGGPATHRGGPRSRCEDRVGPEGGRARRRIGRSPRWSPTSFPARCSNACSAQSISSSLRHGDPSRPDCDR